MGDAIKRLCREDIFTIGHDPFHMYGNYMYQMKASNDLNNNYRYYKNQEMANNFNGKVGFNRNGTSDAAQVLFQRVIMLMMLIGPLVKVIHL